MAIALVHKTFGQVGDSTPVSITVPATTAGNLLVVACEIQNSTGTAVTSITDGGDTFVQCANSLISGGDGFILETWYSKNIAGGATTIVVNYNGHVYAQIYVYELSGASTTSPFVSADKVAQTAAPVSPSLTPAAAGSVLIAIAASPASCGVSAPWTGDNPAFQTNEACFAYNINPSLVATHATWTPTDSLSYVSNIALFAPPAAGPSVKQKSSTSLVF